MFPKLGEFFSIPSISEKLTQVPIFIECSFLGKENDFHCPEMMFFGCLGTAFTVS